MSTKIYDGFKLKIYTLEEIHRATMEFREEIAPHVQEKIQRYILMVAINQFDRHTLGLPLAEAFMKSTKRMPLMFGLSSYWDAVREMKKTNTRDPMVDVGFEVAILPVEKNLILGIPYVDDDKFLKMWMSKDFVEEYGYWNNTDKPDHVTDKQWEERCKNWDKALPGVGIPAMNGFSIQLTRDMYSGGIEEEEVKSYQSPKEKRVKYFADELCMKDWYGEEKIRVDKIFSTYMKYKKAVEEDEKWKNKLDEYKKIADDKLIPVITKDHLLKEIEA